MVVAQVNREVGRGSPTNAGDAYNPLAIGFGERVKRYRQMLPPTESTDDRTCMSQEELANRAQLHRTEISLIERGLREPRLRQIVKLAGSLEVEVGELTEDMFEWEEPKSLMVHEDGRKNGKAKRRVPGRFVPVTH
jgi:transcriptional regulator with XRE-family HTH domain